MTVGLPLMKNVHMPLSKSVLIPFRLTAAAAARNASIKKMGSGMTALITLKKMEDIMKIVQFLKEMGILIKSISETIKNK